MTKTIIHAKINSLKYINAMEQMRKQTMPKTIRQNKAHNMTCIFL